MTNPVNVSRVEENQLFNPQKKVSWAGKCDVIYIATSYNIPEGCSKEAEKLIENLETAKRILKRAYSGREKIDNKVEAVPFLRSTIDATENTSDPTLRRIFQFSHVFLAKAYSGVLSAAFLGEMKIIQADPEMKKQYDQWEAVLNSESIF
jgi:hypothetical protein